MVECEGILNDSGKKRVLDTLLGTTYVLLLTRVCVCLFLIYCLWFVPRGLNIYPTHCFSRARFTCTGIFIFDWFLSFDGFFRFYVQVLMCCIALAIRANIMILLFCLLWKSTKFKSRDSNICSHTHLFIMNDVRMILNFAGTYIY